jgi:large subunit ribosomal protein L18e
MKTNPFILQLIEKAEKMDKPYWKDLARRLSKPRRSYATVNLSKINRYSKKGEIILVPGKVLSSGNLEHPVEIAALSFSSEARKKVERAGGKCLSIEELLELNPGNIRIIK